MRALEDIAEEVRGRALVSIVGAGTKAPVPSGDVLEMSTFAGVVEFHPNDQVVVVRAGTLLAEIQAELGERGQCLPIWEEDPLTLPHSTIGGCVSTNLPHAMEAECGSWRDWVLGLTIVRGDGCIAKTGSQAVKNVAGYDAHKLYIGARGTLGVIGEVILRTYPLKSLPRPEVRLYEGLDEHWWIQRTLPSDFERAVAHSQGFGGFDYAGSSTLGRRVPAGAVLPRYDGDWVMRTGSFAIEGADIRRFIERTQELLDPERKFAQNLR
jgi:hypothetical protein